MALIRRNTRPNSAFAVRPRAIQRNALASRAASSSGLFLRAIDSFALRSRILVFSVGMRLMALKLFRRHEFPQNSSLNLFSSEEIFRIASQRSKVFTIMPKVPAVYVRDLRNECL